MSTWYVNNTLDNYPSIPGSLRWAIEVAANGDFVVSQTTGTIKLVDTTAVPLVYSIQFWKSLTIDGTGLTITGGNPDYGAFQITVSGTPSFFPTIVFKNFRMTQITGQAIQVTKKVTSLSVINCIFDSPIATATSPDCFGLCINSVLSGPAFNILNSTFKNATRTAVSLSVSGGSTVSVSNSVFTDLICDSFAQIAAIVLFSPVTSGAVAIDSSTFSGNSGSSAIVSLLNRANYTVTGSTFDNNYISNGHSLNINDPAFATIESCTFSKNNNTMSTIGTTKDMEILRTTISGNINGGFSSTTGQLTVYSSIISDNQGTDISAASLNSLGYNIYGTKAVSTTVGATSTDIISSNPGLAPLANNGGATMTMALIASSIAFNANKDTSTTNPPFDQRGSPYSRVVGAFQDIGAYERQGPTPTTSQSLTYLEDTPATNSLPNLFTTADGTPVTFTQITVLDPSLFQSTPTLSGNSITAQPAANQFGTTNFTITGTDSLGLTSTGQVLVTILPVNDPPSFTKGKNIDVDKGGPYQFSSWATNVSPGPPNESNQIVSFTTGIVSTTNTIAFTSDPSITSAGLLSFTLDSNTFGVANISVVAMDNGGTLNGGKDTSPTQYFTITLNQKTTTKTPKAPKKTPSRATPSRKPSATPSDGAIIKPSVLEIVDPTSALMLGVVVAKMTTNLWSWASSLFGAKKETETVSIGNIQQCQSLVQECEKKIEDVYKNDIKNESKWLLYSLEDLRDDIIGALKQRRLPTEEDVAEFSERMEAIVEDYYTVDQLEPVSFSPLLVAVKESSASFVDHTVCPAIAAPVRTVARLGAK
eukprot:TRINITY_DN345_c1_g2_i1.p1 TRINITY_DN345_c1_g2~~TRINITY_DN345_c1_g2_i1.p1  ORF type:complete len:818 (-),score=113.58 TRINITY_DN345_c1_g2_i1:102-2555(-)